MESRGHQNGDVAAEPAIGGHTIHKIISSAGYTFAKAKMVLTSNDPEYEQKIQEIVNTFDDLKA